MAEQLQPTCGIEKRALRGGDNPVRIRLAAEDITPEALAELKIKHEVKPGLYSCGPDAFAVFSKIVKERRAKAGLPDGDEYLV